MNILLSLSELKAVEDGSDVVRDIRLDLKATGWFGGGDGIIRGAEENVDCVSEYGVGGNEGVPAGTSTSKAEKWDNEGKGDAGIL